MADPRPDTAQAVDPALRDLSSMADYANGAPATDNLSSSSTSITLGADLDPEESDDDDESVLIEDYDDDAGNDPDTRPATPIYPRTSLFLRGHLASRVMVARQQLAETKAMTYSSEQSEDSDQAADEAFRKRFRDQLLEGDTVGGIPTTELSAWISSGLEGIDVYLGIEGIEGVEDGVVAVEVPNELLATMLLTGLGGKEQVEAIQQQCTTELEARLLESSRTQSQCRSGRIRAIAVGAPDIVAEFETTLASIREVIRKASEGFDLYSGFGHQRYRPSVYSTLSI